MKLMMLSRFDDWIQEKHQFLYDELEYRFGWSTRKHFEIAEPLVKIMHLDRH